MEYLVRKLKKCEHHQKRKHIEGFKNYYKKRFYKELLRIYNECVTKEKNINMAWEVLDLSKSYLDEVIPRYGILIRTLNDGYLGEVDKLYDLNVIRKSETIIREDEVLF